MTPDDAECREHASAGDGRPVSSSGGGKPSADDGPAMHWRVLRRLGSRETQPDHGGGCRTDRGLCWCGRAPNNEKTRLGRSAHIPGKYLGLPIGYPQPVRELLPLPMTAAAQRIVPADERPWGWRPHLGGDGVCRRSCGRRTRYAEGCRAR